jgi:heme exporter protein B
LLGQLRRDLLVVFRSPGDIVNPLAFYLMGITLFPLGVGPGASLLGTIAAGVLWSLALFATLLSLDAVFRRDFEDGTLDQLVIHVEPLFLGALMKVLAHWLVTGLPLALISPLAGLMLSLPSEATGTLFLALLLGTPVLSLLGAVGAALTMGLRRGSLLLVLLVLPLYVPVIILGAGAVTAVTNGLDPAPQLKWLSACLMLALTAAPFATAAALRIGLE